MKINLNKKKIKEFFDNNSIIVVGIAATTITAIMSYGIISEINKDNKINDELSNIHYLTDDEKEIKLSNLYYVEKDNQLYICTKEILDTTIEFNYSASLLLKMPITQAENKYMYKDIKTNEIICTDDDNVNISNVFYKLKNEITHNNISIDDINQEYIEEKTLVKSK